MERSDVLDGALERPCTIGGGGGVTPPRTPPLHPHPFPMFEADSHSSIAYRQDTSKREWAQLVNQLVSPEVIQKPPTPPATPK